MAPESDLPLPRLFAERPHAFGPPDPTEHALAATSSHPLPLPPGRLVATLGNHRTVGTVCRGLGLREVGGEGPGGILRAS